MPVVNVLSSTSDQLDASRPTPLLEVRDLVVDFRSSGLFCKKASNTALKGVPLAVEPGQTVGIVGQSGSGKSTLARTIVGLERATSGTILLEGQTLDRSRASVHALRGMVQMMFQDSLNSLNPRRSIGSTLAEPLVAHGIVPQKDMTDRVAQLRTDVGLEPDFMYRRPAQLSGGQRQRVNIARALVSKPPLIIADELISVLDVSIRSQILDLLITLQRERPLLYLHQPRPSRGAPHVQRGSCDAARRGRRDCRQGNPLHQPATRIHERAPTPLNRPRPPPWPEAESGETPSSRRRSRVRRRQAGRRRPALRHGRTAQTD